MTKREQVRRAQLSSALATLVCTHELDIAEASYIYREEMGDGHEGDSGTE